MVATNMTQQAERIDGKARAADLRATVADQVAALGTAHAITPGLAVVLVGADPASQTYVRSKRKLTRAIGMESFEHNLAASVSQAELLALIRTLNDDERVNGILVQLPLPDHIASQAVLETIRPDKDVDGFHVRNTGALWTGGDPLVPCTPLGCMMLLQSAVASLDGLHAVIIGRSNIVGKPIANLLLRADCTVTLAHSHTRDLPALCRQADILVAATGRPQMVRGDWIKPGAAIIDVGINRSEDPATGKRRLIGDVAFDEACQVAGAITPVPGGVGPMTIACLLHNTLVATCRQHNISIDALESA